MLAGCASAPAARPVALPAAPSPVVSAEQTPEQLAASAATNCRLLAAPAERTWGLAAARAAHARAPAARAAALALARCAHLAADLEKDEARVIALAEEGMTVLAQAHLPPGDAEAAYLHALNLGLFVRSRGMTAVGRLGDLVALLKVAGEKPALDQGGPLRVLGLLYVKAPSWPLGPGDLEAAIELLERAARDYPEHPLNHLYLAYALLDAGERERAREEIGRARELCTAQRFGEWAAHWRDEIEQLLARAR
ncbi:MAG: tetratricopeptide repeat protein [Deltaproteobacteria bacterium]|nr:tetratricopeptide repeat protein [Deltaproteobacteria bacterium]